MNTSEESQLVSRMNAAYPRPDDNADLIRSVLDLRVELSRRTWSRSALLIAVTAVAVILIISSTLLRRPEPSATSTQPPAQPAPAAGVQSTPQTSSPSVPTPSETTSAASLSAAPPAELADRLWRVPGAFATFHLHGSRFEISNGCDEESGSAVINGNTMRLFAVSRAAGPPCRPAVNFVTGALLQTVTQWQVKSQRLTFTNLDGTTLTYVDAGPRSTQIRVLLNTRADIASLANSRWSLPGLNYQLTFADGRATGQVWACNKVEGATTITVTTISITGRGPAFCNIIIPMPVAEQELGWHLDGNLLLLTDRDGTTTQWVRK